MNLGSIFLTIIHAEKSILSIPMFFKFYPVEGFKIKLKICKTIMDGIGTYCRLNLSLQESVIGFFLSEINVFVKKDLYNNVIPKFRYPNLKTSLSPPDGSVLLQVGVLLFNYQKVAYF